MSTRLKCSIGWVRILLILTLAIVARIPVWGQDGVWTGVERVVAMGDVHGDYNQLLTVLRDAGVIDRKGTKWIAGKTHLVQTGDMIDRGSGSRKVMDLFMDLEKEARKAGGAVHQLIGNHEAMNIYGDLRYVTREDYAGYATDNSADVRESYWQALLKQSGPGAAPDRQKWDAEHPLGFFEQRFAFGPKGKYGPWILGHDTVIQINDTLFLHGGIGPKYASSSISEINSKVRKELTGDSKLEGGIATDQDGPLWYRGIADGDESQLAPQVQTVLDNYHVRRMVVGHTVISGAIMPRMSGKVVAIDVGMSKVYGGPPASLLIEDGKLYAIHRGTKVEIPSDSAARLDYLRECAKLDPPDSQLRALVAKMSTAK